MPQIDFLATWDDALRLLESIADIPNIAMFPDLNYPSQDPILVKGADAMRVAFNSPTHIYIWSSDISPVRPQLSRILAGAAEGKFWLSPADDHPLLDFSACNPRQVAGTSKLYPGMVSWKKNWHDPSDGKRKPISQAGKKLISEIKRLVRKQMTRVILHEGTWVGKEALDLFKLGKLTLVDCGRDFRINAEGKLEVKTPEALEKFQ